MKTRGFEVAKGFEDKEINLPKRGTEFSAGYDFESAERVEIPSIWTLVKAIGYDTERFITKQLLGVPLTHAELPSFDFDSYLQEILDSEDMERYADLIKKTTEVAKLGSEVGDLLSIVGDIELNEKVESILGPDLVELKETQAKSMRPVLVPTGIKSYMGENEYLQIVNRSSGPIKKGLVLTNGVGIVDSDYYSNPGNDGHIMGQFINISLDTIVIEKGERIFQGIFHQFLIADGDNADGERIGGHGSTN